MPALIEEPWINSQVVAHAVSEIQDCAIAVDATYYLQQFIDVPDLEPLLPALGGQTGIQGRLSADLDQWKAHGVTPFFVFDGQSMTGQDEVTVKRGIDVLEKSDYAWDIYFNGQANEAVVAFGRNSTAYRPQGLYTLLQTLLKERGLHFLVAPFNAAAQIAYFDMIDSDQCAGVMGPLELMLYPIRDSVIRLIDWEISTVLAISKKHITKSLNVSESLFIDGLLMTGTSFLPPFPALLDQSQVKSQPYNVVDAVNMLRASEKSVTHTCNAFHDIVKSRDPNWLDKYRRARMAVNHFIYIAENGEVKVSDYDHLTKDSHEYLGLQLPAELFHYLNTGLIGPRILTWITHGQSYVLPTLDGVVSNEYINLVSTQLVPIKEAALSLLIPRLNRGIGYKDIKMKVWYDPNFTEFIWKSHENRANQFVKQVGTWNVKESAIKEYFPIFVHGSVASELLALQNTEFASMTVWKPAPNSRERIKGIDSAGLIKSTCIWRFLQIRGYVNEKHELTRWGKALAVAMTAFEPTVTKYVSVPNFYESFLIAFELLRFDLLNGKNKHEELRGLPLKGTEEDQTCLLLISRCATLLKLRHAEYGYTGPLNKNLLAFRSMVSEVRSADRDLIEAIVASMFMHAQSNRNRDDNWQLGHQLPFLADPNVALGIAVKTYFDELTPTTTPEAKAKHRHDFPITYAPYAVSVYDDLEIACNFFDALHTGVQTLNSKEIPAADRAIWDKAAKFLEERK